MSALRNNESSSKGFDAMFKLVLVGDSGVGKSNLLSRFTRNHFTHEEKSTIGVEFATKIVPINKDIGAEVRIKAQVWDTAGQERYRAITNAYYRNAVGAVLVIDLTQDRNTTFSNAKRWLRELRNHASDDVVTVMAGNKIDLRESRTNFKCISKEDAEDFSRRHKIKYFETSALTGENVNLIFESLVHEIHKVVESDDNLDPKTIKVEADCNETKQSRCCSNQN